MLSSVFYHSRPFRDQAGPRECRNRVRKVFSSDLTASNLDFIDSNANSWPFQIPEMWTNTINISNTGQSTNTYHEGTKTYQDHQEKLPCMGSPPPFCCCSCLCYVFCLLPPQKTDAHITHLTKIHWRFQEASGIHTHTKQNATPQIRAQKIKLTCTLVILIVRVSKPATITRSSQIW